MRATWDTGLTGTEASPAIDVDLLLFLLRLTLTARNLIGRQLHEIARCLQICEGGGAGPS
eukprot:SAG11_NODE_2381_length_3426_cov_2.697507_5_plen_60_part_00